MTAPATLTDLIRAAAHALIRRDTLEIQDLARISEGWLQSEEEAEAQRLLLDAILEAACLLEGEPSELESALEDA
ncbi:hypothetical protein ruthe_02527 [Rubellimicrobium thermophilum DSM 16684]|uniref:Uncharacterized protein n=1 Tax=Rubellimicrobium thermophilum DSM 16684 TaxID=1123069 RepID=S9QXE0_9RHOB|nr:hypothetical protein [Rubellimicrobium thermophilum]EPX84313.1 hypothetical protein ruthe_02527 [Rubellimicrobium thermophilum DSM 16684]